MDKRSILLLSASVLASLSGCGPDVAKWKEEVLLHDGRIIVVERTAKAEPRGFLGAVRGRDLEFELKYEPLSIYWRGTPSQDAIEIFDGIPYLIVWPGNESNFCKEKPSTTLPIRVLKMQGKQWIDIDPNTFPVDQAHFNLYLDYWGRNQREDARGLITWEEKAERDAYPIVTLDPLVRRPYKLRERFVRTEGTCARFQQN